MTRTNLTPIIETEQPTAYVKIGKTIIGNSTTLVKIESSGTSVYFYAKPVDDYLSGNKNKARLHENVAELFGPGDQIADPSTFIVDTGVSVNKVPDCAEAELYIQGSATREQVESFMRENNYLLHSIEEVISTSNGFVSVDVASVSPARYSTVRVTPETELTFLDREAYERQKSSDRGRDEQSGSGDAGEMDVDIDVSPEKPTVSFEDDVAGLEEVKETARMLLALFDPETKQAVSDRYGESFASRGGSMLLYGPPGCGKTLVSEAIAYEAANNTNIEEEYGDVKFLPVKGGDILSRYPGEAERRVEAVFEEAHRVAQDGFAVLFFDEIETLIPDRSDDNLQRHERSLTNAFLQEMGTDKMEDNLLVIGATNMPFTIDPAASRRFPLQQFIPQPGQAVMSQVWEKELASLEAANGDANIDYDQLGDASIGYTPAEIADRVLGTDLQRDLIRSVIDDSREPVTPDTAYLLGRLEDHQPKTVRQFVTSVRDEADALEGYPAMRDYVSEQAERLDLSMGSGSLADQLAAVAENDDSSGA
ncbi:AAA family ATPase [Haloarcula sp. H-GB5]